MPVPLSTPPLEPGSPSLARSCWSLCESPRRDVVPLNTSFVWSACVAHRTGSGGERLSTPVAHSVCESFRWALDRHSFCLCFDCKEKLFHWKARSDRKLLNWTSIAIEIGFLWPKSDSNLDYLWLCDHRRQAFSSCALRISSDTTSKVGRCDKLDLSQKSSGFIALSGIDHAHLCRYTCKLPIAVCIELWIISGETSAQNTRYYALVISGNVLTVGMTTLSNDNTTLT